MPALQHLSLVTLCLFALSACGHLANTSVESRNETAVGSNTVVAASVPRTEKPFLDDPDNFQFIVVGDRTGGHRPGVFDHAMDQVNWLQPEFVMCVGDLIEGYSEDRNVLEEEWDELDGMVDKLQMPFFYTVGNHDMGNNIMQALWNERHGSDYYHFIYKNVLFISLNTEDPPVQLSAEALAGQKRMEEMLRNNPDEFYRLLEERRAAQGMEGHERPKLPGQVSISDAQVAYVEQVLNDNPDVRWTLFFMHKPAWEYSNTNPQFEQIEALVQDRPYTMIAGHEHYYSYSNRKGRDYIDMGTTGGVQLSGGPGSLDHVTWVTMTNDGPVIANIALDGLFDKLGPKIEK